jgi:4-hydroxybenzoate polyprenyltransferase
MKSHFWAYLQERFPLHANGLLILSYFSANYLLACSAERPDAGLTLSWRFAAGCLVLLLMFFHLRVIDEHKDFERDRLVHPGRVLSRGLVTLGQLRGAGAVAVALEIGLSALLGPAALLMCIVLLALSWLIYREFYAGPWLERHMLANAFLHLLVMPVYSLYVFSAAVAEFPWRAPGVILLYAWVSYGVGLAYEVARKTRAPHDERPGLITYSAVVGPYPSAYGVLAALTFSGAISALVGGLLDFGVWYHLAVGGLLLLMAAGVLHFRLRTSSATAARLPIYAGLFIFIFDWLLAIELIRLHGLELV